jgi:biopolymer transport protein ExbD
MRLPEEPDISPQINIAPMIDVIFAILTFFIISSLFLNKSETLPVNLPTATTAATQTQNQIAVTIDPQGNLTLNQQAAKLNDLQVRVRALITTNSPTIVVINADKDVNHGRVVAVMDQLRQIPGIRLAIAAQRP